jgi:hypothetical protein
MSLSLRSFAAFTLASALTTALFMPACSQQGEGERCDSINGDTDCDDGLKCVRASDLADERTDRCCDPDQTTFTDSRCRPGTGPVAPVGGAPSDGDAGSGPQAGSAGEATNGGAGGVPSEPDEVAGAGAGGVPSAGGVPGSSSESGAPSGGMVSTPAGGQGGAD